MLSSFSFSLSALTLLDDATMRTMQDQWKDNLPVLATLTKSIDAAMRSLGVDQAFVRLSSRSPKDAALSRPG